MVVRVVRARGVNRVRACHFVPPIHVHSKMNNQRHTHIHTPHPDIRTIVASKISIIASTRDFYHSIQDFYQCIRVWLLHVDEFWSVCIYKKWPGEAMCRRWAWSSLVQAVVGACSTNVDLLSVGPKEQTSVECVNVGLTVTIFNQMESRGKQRVIDNQNHACGLRYIKYILKFGAFLST